MKTQNSNPGRPHRGRAHYQPRKRPWYLVTEHARKEFLRSGEAQAWLTKVLLKVDVCDLPGLAQLAQDLSGVAVDLLKQLLHRVLEISQGLAHLLVFGLKNVRILCGLPQFLLEADTHQAQPEAEGFSVQVTGGIPEGMPSKE